MTFSSLTNIFYPHPTAQYGQTLGTIRVAVVVRALLSDVRADFEELPRPEGSLPVNCFTTGHERRSFLADIHNLQSLGEGS